MKNKFDKREAAIDQLKRDKHTLLEGYVTEFIFEKQFLKNKSYTKGWWMAECNKKKIFFIVKEELNCLDKKIINKLSSPNDCWKVDLIKEDLIFSNNGRKLSKDEFVKKYNLLSKRKSMIANKEVRNENRQNKCIEFFDKNGILEKIAIDRFFANNFLSKYFNSIVNIDCFTEKKGKLNVIEIKFKYETKDNYFGINTGQMNMFEYLNKLGFGIYHFILYNKTKEKELSIFGFLEKKFKKDWLMAEVKDIKGHSKSTAPKYTSVSGDFSQGYFKLSKEEFLKEIQLELAGINM